MADIAMIFHWPPAAMQDMDVGELLHWRNLPQNLESLNARCGIVSRTGFRLSPAAKAMIETLVAVDQHEVSVAV